MSHKNTLGNQCPCYFFMHFFAFDHQAIEDLEEQQGYALGCRGSLPIRSAISALVTTPTSTS